MGLEPCGSRVARQHGFVWHDVWRDEFWHAVRQIGPQKNHHDVRGHLQWLHVFRLFRCQPDSIWHLALFGRLGHRRGDAECGGLDDGIRAETHPQHFGGHHVQWLCHRWHGIGIARFIFGGRLRLENHVLHRRRAFVGIAFVVEIFARIADVLNPKRPNRTSGADCEQNRAEHTGHPPNRICVE